MTCDISCCDIDIILKLDIWGLYMELVYCHNLHYFRITNLFLSGLTFVIKTPFGVSGAKLNHYYFTLIAAVFVFDICRIWILMHQRDI